MDLGWADGPMVTVCFNTTTGPVRLLVDSACQAFGMISERAVKRLGLEVVSNGPQRRIVGWDNKVAKIGLSGRTRLVLQVGNHWRPYQMWVASETAGYDGILGSGWLASEEVVLYQKRMIMCVLRGGPVWLRGENVQPAAPAPTPVPVPAPVTMLAGKTTIADVEAVRAKGREVTEAEVKKRLPSRLWHMVEAFMPLKDEFGGELPASTADDTEIELTTDDPLKWPKAKPRPMTDLELMGTRELLDQYEEKGWITRSNSPIASPVHLVRKDAKPGLRLVIDYKRLNDIVKKDRFPIPGSMRRSGNFMELSI